MEVVYGLDNYRNTQCIALALGNFDGVHRGHREILKITVEKAREIKCKSAVMVFDPHPVHFLQSESRLQILTPLHEKAELMEGLGIDTLMVVPFDSSFASLTPEEFVKENLVDRLQAKVVIVGFDYSFGREGSGKAEDLRNMAAKYSFQVHVVKPVVLHEKIVSSSMVRNLILQGRVGEASVYLGYPYSIRGKVVSGEGRGKFLGYPTANLEVPRERIIPADGVYLTMAACKSQEYYGLTNIGCKPTFQGRTKTIETHIFNFQNSIYENELRLTFLQKLRDEKPFASSDELKEQISRDLHRALELIKKISNHTAEVKQP